MLFLLLCIVSNIYFLLNSDLYRSAFVILLQVTTFISLVAFITMVIFREKKLKEQLHEQY